MIDPQPGFAPVPGSLPFVHNFDTAPAYWMLDILWIILVKSEDTGGRYSLMYQALPKGSGAPPHKHTWSDEHFYILEGEITFWIDNALKRGGKGDFVFVPRNTPHAFRVDSETAAFLNGYTPSGLELAIAELGMPAPSRTIPPNGAAPSPAMTPEMSRRYGMDNLTIDNPLSTGQH